MTEAFLQQKIQCLLDCMERQSYSATAMSLYRRQLRWAEEYCMSRGCCIPSTADMDHFVADAVRLHPKENPLLLRRSWRLLADFFETGEFHSRRYRYGDAMLCQEFHEELEQFRSGLENSGLAEGSIGILIHGVHSFLELLEKEGICSISGIHLSHLNSYIMEAAPKNSGNISNVTWPLGKFLSYLQKQGRLPFDRIPQMPHPVCRRKKVLPCMEDAETSAILAAVDRSTAMGRRDYAIILTAAYTGMRISDIFALELSSIRWAEKEIVFVQKKTGTENVIPLSAEVGNAIAGYILDGRPKSDSRSIFLSTKAPYQPMSASGNRTRIIHKYQHAAGIERRAYDGKGSMPSAGAWGQGCLRPAFP